MSREVSTWLVNGGLFHLLINGVYWGYNLLIQTFDPNFLSGASKQDPSEHPAVHGGNDPWIFCLCPPEDARIPPFTQKGHLEDHPS